MEGLRKRKKFNHGFFNKIFFGILLLVIMANSSHAQTFTPLESLGLIAASQNNNWRYNMGIVSRLKQMVPLVELQEDGQPG